MKNFEQNKPVTITRPDGTEVDYPSQSIAGRAEKLPQSYISRLCRGVMLTYKGFKARFKLNKDER